MKKKPKLEKHLESADLRQAMQCPNARLGLRSLSGFPDHHKLVMCKTNKSVAGKY